MIIPRESNINHHELDIFSSLKKLIDDWLQELSSQRFYSQNTLISYQRDLFDFLAFLIRHKNETISTVVLKDLATADFRAWFSNRINKGLSPRSNARALSSLKSFFHYLAKFGLLEMEVINSVSHARLPKLLPKAIPEKDVLKFLDANFYFEDDEQWITNRDRALYTLLYSTGLRINEALSIKTKDVSSEIKICGKGKKDRVVLLFQITLERIQTYVETCPHDLSDGFLFVGLRGKKLRASYVDSRLKKLQMLYDLPEHTSAHSFRHSFATHLVKEGVDLRSVQELLGHESLSSTQIYTDMDDYSMLKIYEKSHPLEKEQTR